MLLLDLCCFFLAEYQVTALSLALFASQLFPFAATTRIAVVSASVCLQAFILFSSPYTPLLYLLPSILLARLLDGRLYKNPLLPIGTFAICLGAHFWLFQPYLLDSARSLLCTFSANFASIGGAWMISLTLRKQGGRGSRPRP